MPRRILVVEDSPTQAERVRLLLEADGYTTEVAADGSAGLERIRRTPPDLIISDVMMPEMDGYDFCQAVKSSEATRRIPFVLLTERNSPLDIVEGLVRGADNFIIKPFDDDYLLERIQRIFAHLELRKRGALEVEIVIRLQGRDLVISTDKQQIIELLVSTFEELGRVNARLAEAQKAVEEYARTLELKVEERTKALRESEERLLQSQKMEAIGRLAGGIAHDFNNLLTIITSYSEIVLERLGPGHPVRDQIEEIGKAGLRAASMTRQLLAFSRRQVLQPKVLNLNLVVVEIDKMLRRLIGEDIDLATVLDKDLRSVKADPGQLDQVIMNLAVNARDAMPRGGRLTIETANVDLDGGHGGGRFTVAPGPYVMLAISDTGCGMDAETQSHVFEPFFTTKEQGKGTGLGLATVYGIVKQSGGYIWVYSEPGRGTAFKIYLPQVRERAEAARPALAAGRASGGSETVLVVEDEPALRDVVREILDAYGYSVLFVGGVNEAIRLCETHQGDIHLLVTDVVMPQMSGPQLADRIARLRPRTKVLYISGYADKAVIHHGVLEGTEAFLQKPFTPDALARKVSEILHGTPRD